LSGDCDLKKEKVALHLVKSDMCLVSKGWFRGGKERKKKKKKGKRSKGGKVHTAMVERGQVTKPSPLSFDLPVYAVREKTEPGKKKKKRKGGRTNENSRPSAPLSNSTPASRPYAASGPGKRGREKKKKEGKKTRK